jgi:hypothetical protein
MKAKPSLGRWLWAAAAALFVAACGVATPVSVSGATATEPGAAASAVAATMVQATADSQRAQATAAALWANATSTAQLGTAQSQVVLTAEAARATASMANRLATGTAGAATRVARATSTAQPLAASVQRLVSEGYLTTGSGYYESLLDFFREWAQINWYQWYATGKAPRDFVVSAHVAWESASNRANWFNSGCGFVFRETPREGDDQALNHYLAYLGLDGVVYMARQTNGQYVELGKASYGRVDVPDGAAQIMLAVQGDRFHFFVNGEHVLTREDAVLDSGNLNYTLLSGTNRDFGTRCEMTQVGLWWLEP